MVIRKIFGYIKSKIKGNDLYDKKITLTYNGDSSYKTLIGGIVSISIKLLILIYAWILIRVIFKRGDTKKTLNRVIKDLTYDTTKHYIGKDGFAIAIAMNNEAGENLILDPQYFNLSVSQANYVLHSDGFYSVEYTSIPYGAWERDFSYVSEDLVNRNIIQKAAWLKSNDYYISSNYLANASSYLEISLK